MLNFLFRLFLTFNSTSLLIVVFGIKGQYIIEWERISHRLTNMPDWLSYIIYFCIPIILTLISLWWSNLLDSDSLEKTNNKSKVTDIEQANNAFLPSYLGYFFVALSVTSTETLWFIFAILFLFTFFSQTLYFNPLFLLIGFHFYYLTTTNRTKIFLITRKSLKNPDNIDLPRLKRINNFTFIDKTH